MPARLSILLVVAFSFLFYACDSSTISGDFSENQPPRTFLTVEHIELPEEERLASNVEIKWWGDDPDGYVVAYEFCVGDQQDVCDFEQGAWEYTEKTDTTMVLPIPPGDDVADVTFNVRSIDNEGLRDPEGASVTFPIKNSPPSIIFDPTQTPPDTTYSIMSFGWEASDPDGEADLNYIEVAMNIDQDHPEESDWVRLDRDVDFLTMVIDQNSIDENGRATARLYSGRALSEVGEGIGNVVLDGQNTLYLRAFDQSLTGSEIAGHEWFVKEQTSNLLFMNDDNSAGATGSMALHMSMLDQLDFDYDVWDISDALIPSGNVLPTPLDPTLSMALAEWDHIYFISDQLDHNLLYALQFTSEFLSAGGSIFVNIPSRIIPAQNRDPVFNFLPFSGYQELPPGESRFILFPGSQLEPMDDNLEPLTLAAGSQNTIPLVPEGDANLFYSAEFIAGDHDFSRLIAASNQNQSILYFGIDFRNISDDSPLLETLDYFLNDHLGFEKN